MDQIRNDIPTWIDLNNKVSRLTLHGESYEERIHALEDRLNTIYDSIGKKEARIKALEKEAEQQYLVIEALSKSPIQSDPIKAEKKYTEKQVKKAITKTLKEYSAPVYYSDFINYTLKQLKK